MKSQLEKAETFRALHERERAFIIPNPWDAGTARMLAHLGFEALATTSAGNAFSLGVKDGAVGRERTLANLSEIAAATELPVSGDLENGFGDAPEAAAETIRMAAAAGLVGGSIEDATGKPDAPIYPIEQAIERIEAAAEAAHSLPFPFTLTARAENYLYERRDLKDTIHRLRTYQEAGADVLYAPGLTTTEEIAAVVTSVDRPVNVLMGLGGLALGVEDLSVLGVRRISVGGALCRLALGAFLSAAREMKERGTFGFTKRATRTDTIVEMLGDPPDKS
ncbi:MAG TPA: isocitrate lyase/phosphoenolpyruvate mutase family protein [Acidobacteriaceae bacterium]|jgi:2-methylisocitrate lyase-like PEP mutase family enzyme|nr:isocitrate lyase/phosphoenolpyruvate mutase family protein [Acidobacteriaceae bacterium]